MLTIVEDDQQLPLAQEFEQRRKKWLIWLLPQTQGSSNGARHKCSVSQRRKFDKPSAILKPVENAGGNLQRKTGLANAAGTNQRQQVRCLQMIPDLRHVLVPAEEARAAQRQIVGDCVQRLQGRKVLPQTRCND